jgi:hypothetical protein
LSGSNATAEAVLRGYERDGRFEGTSLSFGPSARVTLLKYRGTAGPDVSATSAVFPDGQWVQCEVTAQQRSVSVSLNGQTVATITDSPGGDRTVPAFYVLGEGAELHIKDAKLELLPEQR